jgi:hypothetical protein
VRLNWNIIKHKAQAKKKSDIPISRENKSVNSFMIEEKEILAVKEVNLDVIERTKNSLFQKRGDQNSPQ